MCSTPGRFVMFVNVCVCVCQNLMMNWDLIDHKKNILSTPVLICIKHFFFVSSKRSLSHHPIIYPCMSSVRLMGVQIMMICPINPQMSSAFYIFTLAILKEEEKLKYPYPNRPLITVCSCHEYCQIHQKRAENSATQDGFLVEATWYVILSSRWLGLALWNMISVLQHLPMSSCLLRLLDRCMLFSLWQFLCLRHHARCNKSESSSLLTFLFFFFPFSMFFRCVVRYIPSVRLCSCQVLIVVCLSSCQAFKESEIFIARALA